MTHPRSAFGAPPRGGTASGPAKRSRFSVGSYRVSDVMPELKRSRFSVGSYRASDVMPELKPDPRRSLGKIRFLRRGWRFGAMKNRYDRCAQLTRT